MEKAYGALLALSNMLFRVQKLLLLLAVVVVVTVNFANVCLRYLASYSLNFCESLSVVLFMFMVLLGANLAVKRDGEIKIELFRFSNPRRNAAFKLAGELIAVVCLVLCLYGLVMTLQAVTRNPQRLTPLPLFTYHIYAVMLAGFVLILIDHLLLLLRHVTLVLSGRALPEADII